MDVRSALKEQYHGGLAMLAQCVERCPDDLWIESNPCKPLPPSEYKRWDVDRPYWRIAFHCIFFTHLYMGQNLEAFQPPRNTSIGKREDFQGMWGPPWELEPYEVSKSTDPCTQKEMLEYISYVDSITDSTIDGLDLDSEEPGIPWYKNISKLSHEIMNIRHLQGHVGQLSELLMARGTDIEWRGKASGLAVAK